MTDTVQHTAVNITAHLMEKINADNLKDKTAIIYERPDFSMAMSYGELFKYVGYFAATLRQKGLKKGDRIFIRLTNSPEVVIAYLGAIKAGIIPAMMSTHVGNGSITEYVKETQAKILFSVSTEQPEIPDTCLHYSLADNLGSLQFGGFLNAEGVDEKTYDSLEDPAFITYTSGITNRPKAILHAHRFLQGIANMQTVLTNLKQDAIMAYIGDLAWSFGIYQGILLPLYFGSTIYMYYDNNGFKPEKWWERIVKNNVEILFGTPAVFRMMALVAPQDKGKIRKCMAVGETLPAEIWKIWHDNFGIDIIQSYGQAEIGVIALDYAKEDRIPGKAGRMLPGVNYMVVDDEGKQVQDGVPGHLIVRRDYPTVMMKYIVPAEKNEEVLRSDWYVTGDIIIQHDGVLTYLGRKENILKYKGSKFSVVEIESIYRQHEAVQEAAVIECPDIELGQILKVFVRLKPEFDASEVMGKDIQSFISKKLTNYDVPKRIEFINEMPKTRSGKTRREALRQLEMDKFMKNQAM